MSNMTANQRAQFDRPDLADRRTRMNRTSERGSWILAALTVLFVGVLGVLTYGAIIDAGGYDSYLFLADVVLIVGFLAVWTNRTLR